MSRRPDPASGVFDTLLVQGGTPVALDEHLARLAASVRELYDVTLDVGRLAREVAAVAAGSPLQRVRIDVVPGAEPRVEARSLAARPRAPWHLVVRRLPGGWGAHKWRDRSGLESWTDPADPATDPLLVDEADLLLETGRGSVFVVHGSAVSDATARRPDPARRHPRGRAPRPGRARCRDSRPAGPARRPGDRDEVFVTGSVGGVRPVATCDVAGPWPTGPVTRAVDQALEHAWAR